MTEIVNDNDIKSQSTQTEWSWLEDLKTLGLSSVLDTDKETIENRDISKVFYKAKDVVIATEGNEAQELDEPEEKEIEKARDPKPFQVSESADFEHSPVLEVTGNVSDDSSESDTDSSSMESEDDFESYFPSVGPPQMLQYLRQPPNGLSQDLGTDQVIADSEAGLQKSFFSGPCQFCGQPILPLPTLNELENLPNGQLYCCYQYEEFIKLYISYDANKSIVEDEVIDITPHAPYGTKAARKAAKERAAEKMREKEMERQKVVTAQANFFSFARQVKTVQYALSSIRCLEDGWTVRPTTPVQEQLSNEAETFSIEVNSTLLQRKSELYQKFYENGNLFLVIYPDGTGCCFYPSGNVAVMIISSEKGKYTHIVQKDSDDYDTDDTGILSVFEPNGNSCCYFKDGSLRLLLTPYFGMQLDKFGNFKKRWQWHFIKGHVHSPPFQPVCFSLNKQLSCRVMEQSNVIVTFTSGQRAVRFNVGAKLKAIKLMPPISKKNEDEHFIDAMRKKVQSITEKIKVTMRFPNSPKLDILVSNSEKIPRKRSEKRLQLPKLKGKDPFVVVN